MPRSGSSSGSRSMPSRPCTACCFRCAARSRPLGPWSTRPDAGWISKRRYEHLKARGKLDSEGRKRLKQADRLANVLTPLAKYHATEMGNRVCYQAMQVHGGTGYMREFNVERHFRDIRVTSIYEGTSQLQVVAATGPLLGHALDGLLDEWAGRGLWPGTGWAEAPGGGGHRPAQPLHRPHEGAADDRALIDYYASDLADMAVDVLTSGWRCGMRVRESGSGSWPGSISARPCPRSRGRVAMLQALDPAPVQARETVLAETV